jgi:hypothetical protein
MGQTENVAAAAPAKKTGAARKKRKPEKEEAGKKPKKRKKTEVKIRDVSFHSEHLRNSRLSPRKFCGICY